MPEARSTPGRGRRPSWPSFGREILAEGPASRNRTYPWPDLLTLRETAELAWSARDADLFAWVLACRALPSLNGRYEIRAAVLANLKGETTNQSYIARVLARNWEANDGAQVIPKKPDFQDVPPPPADAPMLPGRWECERVNARYLTKFLDLAERHGIRVVWLLPPVSPGTQARWDRSGDERLFERLIRSAQARYDNLAVLDGRRAGFGRDVFVDGVHLDRDGATALSVGVADALKGAQRWSPSRPSPEGPADRPASRRFRRIAARRAALKTQPALKRRTSSGPISPAIASRGDDSSSILA